MIILSILKSLEIIDIKFSILLTAGDNFKVLLKKYEDNINYEELIEILYEICFLKRFKNNLAKAVQTAVKYLKKLKENTQYL